MHDAKSSAVQKGDVRPLSSTRRQESNSVLVCTVVLNHRTCFIGGGDSSEFTGFISAVNRTIKPLGMELARGYMEDTGEVWYGLVNRNSDAAAKIGSGYTAAQLEFFNRAVSLLHRML